MRKSNLRLLCLILFVPALAAGTQQSSSQTATKAQAQTSADDSVIRETTQNRLCEGLKLIEGKLRQLEGSLSSATKVHNDFKVVTAKMRTEKLTPLFEKRTIGKTRTGQIKTGLVPAEETRTLTQVTGQIRGIKNDLTRIRGTLQTQVRDLGKSWSVIEQDMKRLAGLRSIAGTTPSRQCVVQEAKKVDSELAALGSQAGNLQSQIDDVNAALEQEYGQGPCGDSTTNEYSDCANCCAWQYKITAPEGSLERKIQQLERSQCELNCARISTGSCFKDFDKKAKDLFGLLSDVLKNIQEMRGGTIRNLTG